VDDELAPNADAPERERARRQRIASLQRLVVAAVGLACVALVGSYLVPGGGLRFSSEPERAEGWSAIPWDACGSVRSFSELAEANLDDEALCAALLKARSHSGGDDEFFVLTGEVEAQQVRDALASLPRPSEQSTAPPRDDLQLLLVRSPGNRFSPELPRTASDREDRVDTLAIWFPEDEEPDEVETVLLSSESDSYPALERLIGR
jgi:hypothetical protein